MKLKGLFVGLTTVDIQYLVNTFPNSNSKTIADKFSMSIGWPSTNAAITFSHLGGHSHLISVKGQNQFSSYIMSELQYYNVEFTDLFPLTDQLPTVSSIVTTQGKGDRAVITTLSSRKFNRLDVVFPLGHDDYSVVLVDGFNMEICSALAEQARNDGIPVVLDGGSWKDGMEKLLPYIDIAICSENFQSPEGREEDTVIDFLRRQGMIYIAITRGERPIIYSCPDGSNEIVINPVKVVDTLGAGDILHGAFCYDYAKDKNFVYALIQASRVASLSCQSFGTRSWMKSIRERKDRNAT